MGWLMIFGVSSAYAWLGDKRGIRVWFIVQILSVLRNVIEVSGHWYRSRIHIRVHDGSSWILCDSGFQILEKEKENIVGC